MELFCVSQIFIILQKNKTQFMYSIKDLASEKFVLLNEADLLKIDDVNAVTVSYKEKSKTIKIHIGLYDYLFGTTLKAALKAKINSNLTGNFDVKFGI